MSFLDKIQTVPDFPVPGVLFRDLMPLFADAKAFAELVEAMAEPYQNHRVDYILGLEARGLVLAAAVALKLGVAVVPVRKAGRLPGPVLQESYQLEYGQAAVELQENILPPGASAAIVDDVIATGGTAMAAYRLATRIGAQVKGFSVVLDLESLGGSRLVKGHMPLHAQSIIA